MSTFNDIDIECPECGEEYRGKVWVGVHAGLDPQLKELMMGGELNLVSCPGCSQVAFQEHFLIYQEPAAELVAYVYPENQQETRAELQKAMILGFHEAQKGLPEKAQLDYEPILMFGLEELIEALEKENALAEQSQVAEAICKQNQIKTILLRPSHARRLQAGRIVPHLGKGKSPTRTEILGGLNQLLELDPVLDRYAELKERIEKDPAWTLNSGDVIHPVPSK